MSGRSFLLAAILFLLIAGEFAASVIYFVQLYHIEAATDLAEFVATIKAMTSVTLVTDTALAFTLVFLLQRRKTEFERTDSIINKIMVYSIGTGLITSAWALVGLGTAVA